MVDTQLAPPARLPLSVSVRIRGELQAVSVSPGTPVSAVLKSAKLTEGDTSVIAVVKDNATVLNLSEALDGEEGAAITLEPIYTNTYQGWLILRRTLQLLIPYAISRVAPEYLPTVRIHHSSGRQLCYQSTVPFTEDAIEEIGDALRDIANEKLSIVKKTFTYAKAMDILSHTPQASSLIRARARGGTVDLAVVGDGLWHAPWLLPVSHTTEFCGTFAVRSENGARLLIHLPRVTDFSSLPVPLSEPTAALKDAYDVGVAVSDRLGVTSYRALAELDVDKFRKVISLAEKHMDANFASVARRIGHRRVVCIAGPSSSGKTTFSRRLAIHLSARGRYPVPLSLDCYYKALKDVPLDAKGEPDFEQPNALRLNVLADQVKRLLAGETVVVPEINFAEGTYYDGEELSLPDDGVLILEGIHGLNPVLLPDVPHDLIYRVFISPLTALRIDPFTRMSTADVRLIRRIVRDSRTRGCTADKTLTMWPSVRQGEHQHIFPFSHTADSAFNSALCFEVAVLKPMVIPLLNEVPMSHPMRYVAQRLIDLLELVPERDASSVPATSLVREFLGGGCFGAT